MVVAPILFSQLFCNFAQLLMLDFVPQPNLLGLFNVVNDIPELIGHVDIGK